MAHEERPKSPESTKSNGPSGAGAGRQPVEPATEHEKKEETASSPAGKADSSGRQTRKADVNIAPESRVGAAGAREDSEAGGA